MATADEVLITVRTAGVKAAGADIDRTRKKLEGLGRAARGVGKDVRRTTRDLERLATAASELSVADALGMSPGGGRRAGSGGIDNARASLARMRSDVGKTNALLRQMELRGPKRSPFAVSEIVGSARQLQGFNRTAQRTVGAMRAVRGASSGTGRGSGSGGGSGIGRLDRPTGASDRVDSREKRERTREKRARSGGRRRGGASTWPPTNNWSPSNLLMNSGYPAAGPSRAADKTRRTPRQARDELGKSITGPVTGPVNGLKDRMTKGREEKLDPARIRMFDGIRAAVERKDPVGVLEAVGNGALDIGKSALSMTPGEALGGVAAWGATRLGKKAKDAVQSRAKAAAKKRTRAAAKKVGNKALGSPVGQKIAQSPFGRKVEAGWQRAMYAKDDIRNGLRREALRQRFNPAPKLPKKPGFLGRAWNSAKNAGKHAWDGTKSASKLAWNGTKSASKLAWDGTKLAGRHAWEGTKLAGKHAWEGTKVASKLAWKNRAMLGKNALRFAGPVGALASAGMLVNDVVGMTTGRSLTDRALGKGGNPSPSAPVPQNRPQAASLTPTPRNPVSAAPWPGPAKPSAAPYPPTPAGVPIPPVPVARPKVVPYKPPRGLPALPKQNFGGVGVFTNKYVKPQPLRGLATGGTVGPGELTLVGERGPEIARFPAGTQITTNRDTRAKAAGAASGKRGRARDRVVRETPLNLFLDGQAFYRAVSRQSELAELRG